MALALAGCGGDDSVVPASPVVVSVVSVTVVSVSVAVASLVGVVGPGFTITLSTSDGESVTTLPAGDYTIEVDDQADITTST